MAAEIAKVVTEPGSPAKYLMFVAVQTVGFGIVMANSAPIYRQMAGDFSKHQPQPGILWWAVAAVILIQTAYWLRVRLQPALPRGGNVVLAHLVLFIGRLSFILGSSTFTVMFLVRFAELSLPPQRVLMVLALLFSMFCFTLELEQLGRALNGPVANRETRTNP
jgi:hypothetical protein